ncbi:unnamed protein product, partial [Callosobruchus maculatus]
NSQHSPPRPHFKRSICLFNSPSLRGKRLIVALIMVTPYFSKLCHGHTCLLNAPSNLIFTATRIVDQRTEVHKALNYLTTAY